jgi:hypothetical protein
MSGPVTEADGALETASAASACSTTRSPVALAVVVATAPVAPGVGGREDGGRLLATR